MQYSHCAFALEDFEDSDEMLVETVFSLKIVTSKNSGIYHIYQKIQRACVFVAFCYSTHSQLKYQSLNYSTNWSVYGGLSDSFLQIDTFPVFTTDKKISIQMGCNNGN